MVVRAVDPVAVLKQFTSDYRTQREAAAALGISTAYLSDMLNRRRDMSAKILAKLGLRTVVIQS